MRQKCDKSEEGVKVDVLNLSLVLSRGEIWLLYLHFAFARK